MKKMMALCLILVFVFFATACKEKQKPKSQESAICYSADGTKTYDLSAKEIEYITNLFDNATWENNTTNCVHDIEFQIENNQIRYCSSAGAFDNFTNGKTTTVSEEQRVTINKMLGLEK